LGNLDAQRDWGHAKDYVEGMWRMLQQDNPDDYVLATGRTVTIREFVNMSFAEVGKKLEWQGEGVNEQGICAETGDVLVSVDPRYFRPAEVELLVGDASKAKRVLDWEPTCTLEALCSEMVKSDIALFERNKLLKDEGHDVHNQYE
jgi:GDPmannose 4,6-dehydratase